VLEEEATERRVRVSARLRRVSGAYARQDDKYLYALHVASAHDIVGNGRKPTCFVTPSSAPSCRGPLDPSCVPDTRLYALDRGTDNFICRAPLIYPY